MDRVLSQMSRILLAAGSARRCPGPVRSQGHARPECCRARSGPILYPARLCRYLRVGRPVDSVQHSGDPKLCHTTLHQGPQRASRGRLSPPPDAEFDYEGELAVVIGKAGRHIKPEQSWGHIAGYACFNDGSIRDCRSTSPFSLPFRIVSLSSYDPPCRLVEISVTTSSVSVRCTIGVRASSPIQKSVPAR